MKFKTQMKWIIHDFDSKTWWKIEMKSKVFVQTIKTDKKQASVVQL